MSRRLTWVLTSLVGVVVVAGAASFAPRALPAAPPPVRLEGTLVNAGSVSQTELVVVPNPSVDLGLTEDSTTTTTSATTSTTTTTTTTPASTGTQVDDGSTSAESPDDDDETGSTSSDDPGDSDDDSADGPDDDD